MPEEQGWRRGADHRYVTHKASDNSVYLRQTPALFRLQFNGVEGERAYKIWRERNIRNEECRKALGLPCG